ncbi:MAG: hypothetical protein A3C85_00970 [Candidatus Doudnabacteria bacterium RIFCSPHIGHO2_02_FULL_48_21]|nr:MAG: hypothetical protein A3K05_04620 [Candidatus Doudnabacteria bacterium RIFCSPHIGHO2_01_48_18]OGE79882.1 MAG: hypothetical protein A2668_04670 [Candidatus Doudnabacteria bacterium RIFCSPHIGHO2_01_FULL_48_180]OGE94045.1 MAG: hypothetical protein A3C85_00970 [Candidatus Doudnabacteria bacterium RIFCSPHIGHO2_02_FULL_48_21]
MTSENEKSENVKTIRELLGMDVEDEFALPTSPVPVSASGPAPVLNLPVPEVEEEIHEAIEAEEKAEAVHEPEATEFEPVMEAKSKMANYLGKDWIRYPLIFLVTLVFFYLVLNFRGLTKQFTGFLFPPKANQEVVLGDEFGGFNEWIRKYYVYVSNDEVLAANNDPDGDGLTNMDEFYLGTNPFRTDTDRDGTGDGREILAGSNPLYEGSFHEYQRQIVAEHLDRNVIASRIDYNNSSGVAGQATAGPFPQNVQSRFIVDTNVPGEIEIPRLSVKAPVIWSKQFENMEEDLKWGTAHHPLTPYPGERGTSSIHGHSSGNFDDGNFKTVFTRINFLEPGDEVFVTVHSINRETRKYRFIVRAEKVYAKTDPAQFADKNAFILNLSTSWPVGTARERYVVTTELVGL